MSNNDLIARAELAEEALERVKAQIKRMRNMAHVTMLPDVREIVTACANDLDRAIEGGH